MPCLVLKRRFLGRIPLLALISSAVLLLFGLVRFSGVFIGRQTIDIKARNNGQGKSLFQLHNTMSHEELLNMDMESRGQIQRLRVAAYCSQHSLEHLTFAQLKDKQELYLLRRHLLYDTPSQTILCWVEKIACTELKRMMAIKKGIMPEESVGWAWDGNNMAETYIYPLYGRHTLTNTNASTAAEYINTYYKMMVVRDPLERLLSGYLDKIVKVHLPIEDEFVFPLTIKRELIARYHPAEYENWIASNYSEPVISFEEFVDHVLNTDLSMLNSHFRPMTDVCHPCRIKYHFYGSFKHIDSDGFLIAERIGAKKQYFRNKSEHKQSERTASKLAHYYSQLRQVTKTRLSKQWKLDLEFYYYLHPEERHTHNVLLGISPQ